jgi:hypothetical protein
MCSPLALTLGESIGPGLARVSSTPSEGRGGGRGREKKKCGSWSPVERRLASRASLQPASHAGDAGTGFYLRSS